MTDEESGWPGDFHTLRDTLQAEGRALLRRLGYIEVIYSYERTREIDTLIVGRASTSHGVFV